MSLLALPVSDLVLQDSVWEKLYSLTDCLEGRDRFNNYHDSKVKLFHFEADILKKWNESLKDEIENIIETNEFLDLITFHMASRCVEQEIVDGKFYCLGEVLSKEQIYENVRQNIAFLTKIVGDRNIDIAVENNNYYQTGAYELVTDADFINDLVAKFELYFLLDIAHAYVTAHNSGKSVEEYLNQLPCDKIVQIHISQFGWDGEIAYDAHFLPDDETLELTRAICDKYSPKYLTVEYYKDSDKLIDYLNFLKGLKYGN